MKRVLIIGMIFISIFRMHGILLNATTVVDDTVIHLESETMVYGLPFEVSIYASQYTNLVGFQIKIYYDSNKVAFIEEDSSSILKGSYFNHVLGIIYYNHVDFEPFLDEDGLLLRLIFTPLYELSNDTQIFVIDEAYTEFVQFKDDELHIISLSYDINQSSLALYGDVSLDQELKIDDIAYIQLFLSDKKPLTNKSIYLGDVNHDGKLSILDAALIQLYLAGLIDDLGPQKMTIDIHTGVDIVSTTQYKGRPLYIETFTRPGYIFDGYESNGLKINQHDLLTEHMSVLNVRWIPMIQTVSFLSTHIETNQSFILPHQVFAKTVEDAYVYIDIEWDQYVFSSHISGTYMVEGFHPLYEDVVTYTIHVRDSNEPLNLISGYVFGTDETVQVTLSNNVNVWMTETDAYGYFEFAQLLDGNYIVRVNKEGYLGGEPLEITFKNEVTSPITLMSMRTLSNKPKRIEHISFYLEKFSLDGYYFEWFFTGDVFGYETSVEPIEQRKITILEEEFVKSNDEDAMRLEMDHQQYLVNKEIQWSSQYISRMYEIFNRIPIHHNSEAKKTTYWFLTSVYIKDDIEIVYGEDYNTVTISVFAFANATTRLVDMDGLKGTYFSNRLYHAVVTYVTSEGKDLDAVDYIFQIRFGVTIIIHSYPQIAVYNEPAHAFQQFKPYELLQILQMFEEMPKGFHHIEGLNYLIRRKDGTLNPIYPNAPAIAWISHGYIEFMESAFTTISLEYLHRLIIHEKAHFMWHNLFDDALKNDWIDIGGWYQTDESSTGWATTKTTEFVSAYAHAINPDEDMSESISYYLVNPDQLRARAPLKYDFIEKRIMKGTRYVSVIREDLTFQVFNLWPDYDYPGKITRVKVTVDGLPEEDKLVTIEIELNQTEGLFDGADYAGMRVYNIESKHFFDMYLTPVNASKNILRGSYTVSKFYKSGYYTTDQITIGDTVGNQRFEGHGTIKLKAYINNPLEDLIPPIFLEDTFKVEVSEFEENGYQIFEVLVSFEIIEDNILLYGTAHIYINSVDSDAYSYQSWGWYDTEDNLVKIKFRFNQFHPYGNYDFGTLRIFDLGGNMVMIGLHMIEGFNEKHAFFLATRSPDYDAPEMDLNRIYVTSSPVNPDAPNGETYLRIVYYARDNRSGLGTVFYGIRNPLGHVFHHYHYHNNTQEFFIGDPTAWAEYVIEIILPQGSVPGVWGLLEMSLNDKVNNSAYYNFAEIITFELWIDDN
jgi:hypothetical protein